MLQGNCEILKREQLTETIFDVTVSAPEMAAEAKPGQFAQIRAEGFFLRRPISICEIDKAAGTLRFVFEVRGGGTEALSRLAAGEKMDLIAPLGNGFTLLPQGEVIVIGGGIGVPPMLGVSLSYHGRAKAILGFRSRSAVILESDFIRTGQMPVVCTDDGSYGKAGVVTEALVEQIALCRPGLIAACGPEPMLRAVIEVARREEIPCEVSLEQRMACGVGACLVCACRTVKNGEEHLRHVCKDGPVFPAEEVLL